MNDPQNNDDINEYEPDYDLLAKDEPIICPDCFGLDGEHTRASCQE